MLNITIFKNNVIILIIKKNLLVIKIIHTYETLLYYN